MYLPTTSLNHSFFKPGSKSELPKEPSMIHISGPHCKHPESETLGWKLCKSVSLIKLCRKLSEDSRTSSEAVSSRKKPQHTH